MPARGRGKNIPETITNFSVEIQNRNGMKVCDTKLEEEYQKMGITADAYDEGHEGQDPAGISTQPGAC